MEQLLLAAFAPSPGNVPYSFDTTTTNMQQQHSSGDIVETSTASEASREGEDEEWDLIRQKWEQNQQQHISSDTVKTSMMSTPYSFNIAATQQQNISSDIVDTSMASGASREDEEWELIRQQWEQNQQQNISSDTVETSTASGASREDKGWVPNSFDIAATQQKCNSNDIVETSTEFEASREDDGWDLIRQLWEQNQQQEQMQKVQSVSIAPPVDINISRESEQHRQHQHTHQPLSASFTPTLERNISRGSTESLPFSSYTATTPKQLSPSNGNIPNNDVETSAASKISHDEEVWEGKYRELCAFRSENGHSKVPSRFKSNPKLG